MREGADAAQGKTIKDLMEFSQRREEIQKASELENKKMAQQESQFSRSLGYNYDKMSSDEKLDLSKLRQQDRQFKERLGVDVDQFEQVIDLKNKTFLADIEIAAGRQSVAEFNAEIGATTAVLRAFEAKASEEKNAELVKLYKQQRKKLEENMAEEKIVMRNGKAMKELWRNGKKVKDIGEATPRESGVQTETEREVKRLQLNALKKKDRGELTKAEKRLVDKDLLETEGKITVNKKDENARPYVEDFNSSSPKTGVYVWKSGPMTSDRWERIETPKYKGKRLTAKQFTTILNVFDASPQEFYEKKKNKTVQEFFDQLVKEGAKK